MNLSKIFCFLWIKREKEVNDEKKKDKSRVVLCVRPLKQFIKGLKIKEQKRLMAQKAKKLLPDYPEDKALIAFTDLNGEDFL